jgi:hypothetical protein
VLGIAEWARDLLLSRGSLADTEDGEAVRAFLPEQVARALGAQEWLSLRFGAGPGADDAGEWIERLGALLPSGPIVAGVRPRNLSPAVALDAEAALAHGLVIQNGIYRRLEDYAAAAKYGVFAFEYSVESDDRSLGLATVCLNATAQSEIPQPESFVQAIRDGLEEDPSVSVAPQDLARLFAAAERNARREIGKQVASLEESANRRLARDIERVESYYAGLAAQIGKRLAKRAGDPEAAEKERSRALATEADRANKIEDLVRKYSLRVRIGLAGCLLLALPVREIPVLLIRKKEERRRIVHWNPALRLLEPLLCEACSGRAHPLYLCERAHCLCKDCWAPCPACGKPFCRACQTRCRCGGSAANGPRP